MVLLVGPVTIPTTLNLLKLRRQNWYVLERNYSCGVMTFKNTWNFSYILYAL